MLARLLDWLAGTIIGQAFAAIREGIADRLRDLDQQAKGRAEQKAADQGAALDAARRMEEAAAKPHDDKATQGRLDAGTF